jgi:photosystem II stability/assembly factor-like uncharacterized protein
LFILNKNILKDYCRFLWVFFFLFSITESFSLRKKIPRVEIIHSGMNTSLRGLSVVNNNIVWVSGSHGMVGRSTNSGKNWKWMTVPGFEKNDFRDIEAFDANTALIMSIDAPAYILKTSDGGNTWKIVYENKTKGMFLDAMEFRDVMNGIVIGDPVDGRFFLAQSHDGGNSWQEMEFTKRPLADSGEACFASSGTNIRYLYNRSIHFASGGKNSRVFTDFLPANTPFNKGTETAGCNSIAVYDNYKNTFANHMVITGGDFTRDSLREKNCFYSNDGGKSWQSTKTPPGGYRSCVEYLSKDNLVTCGLNGVDYSYDGGKNWYPVSTEGFHACRYAKFGTQVYLTGSNGKIGKLVW